MSKRLSKIKSGKKICIICEGFEEGEYISKLIELSVWNKAYDFSHVNAESNGNIFARYQEKFSSGSYEL